MRKLALIALAAAFAATGAVSTASAALSDRDAPVWRQADGVQVAARGDNKGGRNEGGRKDGGRSAHRDKKGSKVIWRVRDKHHRHFFLFRGRGDCRTETVQVRDDAGNLVVRNARICN